MNVVIRSLDHHQRPAGFIRNHFDIMPGQKPANPGSRSFGVRFFSRKMTRQKLHLTMRMQTSINPVFFLR
ncbi:hypothetical protein KBTX_04531 [wastewater metagenome]|uniref:Uncharacterized protein n=2 Tax=unclassified sequences TaxID=12908 RepID=A0A5B8RK48_9ZZZZ|nr:hypothetical protein KBTEX_04531 [uncultured organism]